MRLRALLAAPLLLVACDTDFDPQYRVEDLRVLALRANATGSLSADVRLGDTLSLEALFFAKAADLPGLTVTWYGCVPGASELLLPCEDPELLAHPERLAAAAAAPPATRVVELLGACRPADPDDACGITVPLPQPAAVQAALDFVMGLATFPCRPYAELPVVALVEAGGRSALALKTVRIVPTDAELAQRGLEVRQVLNLNPEIFMVVRAPDAPGSCDGGTPIADPGGFPAGPTVLCALSSSAPQELRTCGPGGLEPPSNEAYDWQWYVTAGEFPDEGGIGNATGREIDFVRPAGAFRLWTILRDGRGGVGWLHQDLAAVP